MSLRARLSVLKNEINVIKQSYEVNPPPLTLLAASKNQSASLIEEAIKEGITVFGENRVQEAETKWPSLKRRYPDITLHLIGPLQTNKVKAALTLFDVIQTLDRPRLAEEISRIWGLGAGVSGNETRDSKPVTRSFYIQINTGKEPQKAGIIPEEADAFIEYCAKDMKLPVVGLMCIPPADQPSAPHFALLKKIAARHGLKELSMGMSEDYEPAIRMGSTCIRIGRKLFGERQPN